MRLLIGTREGLRDGEGASLGLGGRSIRALAGRPDDAWMVVDGREVWRLKDGRMTVAASAGALSDPALTCVVPGRRRRSHRDRRRVSPPVGRRGARAGGRFR